MKMLEIFKKKEVKHSSYLDQTGLRINKTVIPGEFLRDFPANDLDHYTNTKVILKIQENECSTIPSGQ
jgi:hypothetical protein